LLTASVATEWLYIAKHDKNFEAASLICELVASCFCYSLIVMQFFSGTFVSKKKRKNKNIRTVSWASSSFGEEQTSDKYTDGAISYGDNSEKRIAHF
jgi:hypothetical protein